MSFHKLTGGPLAALQVLFMGFIVAFHVCCNGALAEFINLPIGLLTFFPVAPTIRATSDADEANGLFICRDSFEIGLRTAFQAARSFVKSFAITMLDLLIAALVYFLPMKAAVRVTFGKFGM